MSNLKSTDEQLAIVDFVKNQTANLQIRALAGSGKTSTLVQIAHAIPNTRGLCLAFNKKIAEEMKERLPDNMESRTLNALGHRVWADKLGKRVKLEFKKEYDTLRETVEDQPNNRALFDNFKDLLTTFKEARKSGYIPAAAVEKWAKHRPQSLYTEEDFFAQCEIEHIPDEMDVINEALCRAIDLSFEGIIDFADQIYMPALFKCTMPRFPLIMVDEAQDLSGLDHAFLRKLVMKRLIAVGDPCQAIYGFRGAAANSMDDLREEHDMHVLPLSISFRCPEEIVRHVQWRAPHMQWFDANPNNPGEVTRHKSWSVADVPDGSAVICRNNAPLFAMAITFLREGRYPKLLKGDIINGLINHMQKLGPSKMPAEDVMVEITRWEKARSRKSRASATIRDQAECMRIFVRETDATLGAAVAFAKDIVNQEGPIEFMTGHKSKGLEYRDVFFLDQDLVGQEDQEPNLRYVICTRALSHLHYVSTGACVEFLSEEEG